MRADMYKLITECYREGGGYGYKHHRRRLNQKLKKALKEDNYDVLDNHESMRRCYIERWQQKSFGENLAPLIAFVKSRVGHFWADVHSEMSAHINCNSEQQRHIWLHAIDYVEEKTFMGDDGKVWYNSEYTWGSRNDLYRPIENSYAYVYVHPETLKLELVPNARNGFSQPKKWSRPKINRIVIEPLLQAHNIWGDWYLIELRFLPPTYWKPWTTKQVAAFTKTIREAREKGTYVFGDARKFERGISGEWVQDDYKDVATSDICKTYGFNYNGGYYAGRRFGWCDINKRELYGRPDVYAHSRKQMNTHELRKYGIKKVAGREGEYFRK